MQKQFHTKNQHYVPQFYLRNFSEDGRSLKKVVLSSGKVFETSSIKGECSKDYFYGNDGFVERMLGCIEEDCAEYFRDALQINQDKDVIPNKMRCCVAAFAALQSMRTKKSKTFFADTDKEHNKILAGLYERDFGPDSIPDELKEKDYSTLSQTAVYSAIMLYPALCDLTCIFLDNETDEEFVLSDNPVVCQNPLLEKFTTCNCSGFATRGLQIFIPLTPRRVVCLYDSEVYKFPHKSLVHIYSKKDVIALNNLQFINAESNVYFKANNIDIPMYLDSWKKYVEKQPSPVRTLKVPDNPDALIILSSIVLPMIDFKLSIFSIKSEMLRIAYQGNPDFLWTWIRNPIWHGWCMEFIDQVNADKRSWMDFDKFYEEKMKSVPKDIR